MRFFYYYSIKKLKQTKIIKRKKYCLKMIGDEQYLFCYYCIKSKTMINKQFLINYSLSSFQDLNEEKY